MELTDGEIAALGDDGFFVRDGFVGREPALGMRSAAESVPLRAAGMGRARAEESNLRGDEIGWLVGGKAPIALAPLVDAFAALREAANRQAWLGLDRFDVQIARYSGEGA